MTMKPTKLLNYFADARGATMIEYGLIAALVALLLIGALTSFGSTISSLLEGANAGLSGDNR